MTIQFGQKLQTGCGISNYIPDFAMHLLKKVGINITQADRELFNGCQSVEDIMWRLTNSGTLNRLFWEGSQTSKGRLGEFYVALRCEARWETRPGFDVWGAFEYAEKIMAGKIEVKTVGPTKKPYWEPRISGNERRLIHDVLVVVARQYSLNPCNSSLFAIPKEELEESAQRWWSGNCGDPRPRIKIHKNRFSKKSGQLNQWWEFELLDHSKLRNVIGRHLSGDFVIATTNELQLPLL